MEALFAQWEWGAPPFLGGAPREQRVGTADEDFLPAVAGEGGVQGGLPSPK